MELRQLAYFDAVVRHGGFTRAADALHVAQPAISAQVRKLERELGVDLLTRTTRSVALTPAGTQLLPRVRTVLHELDTARAEMGRHAEIAVGRVRIGATPVVGDLPLPGLLARFRQAYPGVDLELGSGLVADLLARLVGGELDLVVGPDHGDDRGLLTQRVANEDLVVITPPALDHDVRLLADVAEQPFVCLPRGSGLRGILDRHAAEQGWTPRFAFEAHDPASVRALVSAGLGVAIIAASAATAPGEPVRVHRPRDAPSHPAIAVFRRRRADRATRALYDVLVARTNSP